MPRRISVCHCFWKESQRLTSSAGYTLVVVVAAKREIVKEAEQQ